MPPHSRVPNQGGDKFKMATQMRVKNKRLLKKLKRM